MKALSIRQPWAWAILHAGKRIENRSRRMHYRGPLLIHVSGTICTHRDYVGAVNWMRERGVLAQEEAPSDNWFNFTADADYGKLVGIADVCGCVEASDSPWFIGPYGIELARVRAFVEPIPYRGQFGLFDVPDELVRKAIKEARHAP